MQIIQLPQFRKEFEDFPLETREDVFALITRFIKGERMGPHDFKTFKIDGSTKIQEFKVKDSKGNWRVISTIVRGNYLVLVHAFHKKSQQLLEKGKETIRQRIKRIEL